MITRELSECLLALGTAGVEVALHPSDPSRLRFRPADLPSDLVAIMSRHRDAVRRLMAVGCDSANEEATAVLNERLGTAADLGMPTHPGSPGWLIAAGESLSFGCSEEIESK